MGFLSRGLAVALVSVLALPALAGCVDCFDDGELEAAHREGEAQAIEVNEVQYARGYDEGSRLTHADGVADGDFDGYEDGYFDGYYGPTGYPAGYDAGYFEGQGIGVFDPTACSLGADAGFAEGSSQGFGAGWDEGYGQGWDEGYADGFADGAYACGALPSKVDPDELEVCTQRGYDRRLDRTARERGYAAGKRENPEYQAGYVAQYELAYGLGRGHGELDGYDDGRLEGYDDGYADGYDYAFFECYDQAYPDGWDAGSSEGWLEGLGVGYDEGYLAGFEDASSQC